MHALGISLVWSAAQGALLLTMAAGLYFWATRRGPVAAASVAGTALTVLLILTPLALCPLPSLWDWPAAEAVDARQAEASPPRIEVTKEAVDSTTVDASASGGKFDRGMPPGRPGGAFAQHLGVGPGALGCSPSTVWLG